MSFVILNRHEHSDSKFLFRPLKTKATDIPEVCLRMDSEGV